MVHAPISILTGDLPASAAAMIAAAAPVIGVDTETTGLSPRTDLLRLVQVHAPTLGTWLLRATDNSTKPNLADLLANPNITKVFHYAPFDLAFLPQVAPTRAQNVRCTRAASKLLDPTLSHSLINVAARELGVTLTKGAARVSDWGADTLTPEQVAYAVADVEPLPALHARLDSRIRALGLAADYAAVCAYFPVHAWREAHTLPDLIDY